MKLEEDFNEMFMIVDETNKGFLTSEEVLNFYRNLFCHDIDIDLITAVLKKVCKSDKCLKQHFQNVLVLLEEWRIRDDNAYWDFKQLDRSGQDLISLSSALLLARSVKKDAFSLEEWNTWKNDTKKADDDISWNEFKSYMYFEPTEKYKRPTRDDAVEKSYSELKSNELHRAVDDHQFFKASYESDEAISAQLVKEKQLYQEDVQNESSRLANRWKVGGVEAVIYDDGAEWDAADDQIPRDDVTIAELLSAMDEKYDLLRDKLLKEMVGLKIAVDHPNAKNTRDQFEKEFTIAKSKERNLRKSGRLEEELKLLDGSDVMHGRDLFLLMGDTANGYQKHCEERLRRYAALKEEGKTACEVYAILEQENTNRMNNSNVTCGSVLIGLWKRQEREKQEILDRLKSAKDSTEKLIVYTALYRQCERAKEGLNVNDDVGNEISFEASAASVGVAERKQVFDTSRYSEDSMRQEMIAFARTRLKKYRKSISEPPVVGDRLQGVSQVKNMAVVDSWVEVTKLVEKKHEAEREMLLHFVHNLGRYEKNLQEMRGEEQEERRNALLNNFHSWKEEQAKGGKDMKVSKRPYQLALLHEGLALYIEQLKRELLSPNSQKLFSVVLGRLQTLQDVQFQDIQQQLKKKNPTEIYQLRKLQYRAIRDEHFESIADLIFPIEQLSEEELKLNSIIARKYDLLREKLFVEQVKRYYGNEDAEKMVIELKKEESDKRDNRDDLKSICDRFKILYSANELLGPLYSRFLNAAAAHQSSEQSIALDEASIASQKEENFLSELQSRCKDECAVIRNEFKATNDKASLLRSTIDEQLWLVATLDCDKSFLSSVNTLGLIERTKLGNRKVRLAQDTQRFVRCAQERYSLPDPFKEDPANQFESESSEVTATLRSLLPCHCKEWKTFRAILNDKTAEDLREAASLMTSDERVKRLTEINSKRKGLDVANADAKEDLLSLLEEATAIKHVSRKEILRNLVGEEGANDEDVSISLLADLHQEQLVDNQRRYNEAAKQRGSATSGIATEIESHTDRHENIFKVLCKYEGEADDDALMKALDDKYDALRDKLLSEALMRQIGEEEWRRMTERERQERLMRLKMEERRLRREGKMDELARLLGDAFANDTRMKQLLGESREEYERRLKERLAARKRGEFLPEEEDADDLASTNGSNNPLLDLGLRLEDEKAALLRMLGEQDGKFMSEKERQAALLRLRQARLRAAGEDRYEAAALVSGLVDRENAENERLKSDRERQRELARKRLEELKKRGQLPALPDDQTEIIRDGERSLMEEAILKKLRFLQSWERAWLTSLLGDVTDPLEMAQMMSSQQLTDKLQAGQTKIPKEPIVLEKHRKLLADVALYRQALLGRQVTDASDQSRDDIKVTILADLQEIQDQEGKVLADKMADMGKDDLVAEQENFKSLIDSGSSRAVPLSLCILSTGVSSEDELLDALKGKYDAVIDSLAAKVLPDKVGKSNWDKMSDEERQKKIVDLASRVKELINAGRFDEALDLLTEGLSEEKKKEVVDALLGDEDERRRFDLSEREKRMEERIKNGMSPEEAKRLFDEEGLQFEEQEKMRRKNILEGLVMDLNAERDALLKAYRDAKDRLEAEKKRQALLAKLRLQERMLRREENLSSVGRLLAMSRDHDDAIDKERQRQMMLAKERLEAMKRRRADGVKYEEGELIDLRLDSDDVVVLADAVMREMEAKHDGERKALMRLMGEAKPGTDLRETVEKYSSAQCKNRTRELREMRRQWRNEDPQTLLETKDEHWEILKEATALQISPLCSLQSLNEEEGQTYMLAFLQAEQKRETTFLLAGLLEKNPDTVRKMAEAQRMSRTGCWYDNVANSLLGTSGKSEKKDGEEEVVKALEEKYDALKDKLLAEALMKKLGEQKWAALSEKERQRRILQIKKNEKKLRRQGKYDELEKLFHNLAVTEEDVNRIFGEQKLSQEEALKKRRERIAQVRMERVAKGLDVNDAEIEKQVDDEERVEKKKRTNILLALDQNLDSERDALLSDLRRQQDSVSEERRRQLAVAKLRRQRRQVEAEEKLTAIEYVLQTAKQDEDALEARLAENRERHLALAMQRLGAKKTQKQRKQALANLTNPDLIYEKLKAIAGEENEGSSAEQLMFEMEKKHVDEKEVLTLLLLAAEYDESKQQQVEDMSHEQLNEHLEMFHTNRRKWREERMMRAIAEDGGAELKDEQRKSLSNYVSDQNKLLISALRQKLEVARRESLEEGDPASLKDRIVGEWLTDLEHTQENEISTTTDLIGDKSEDILHLLTQGQKRARREEWIDNIGKVVFGLALPGQEQRRPASSSSSLDQEIQKIEAESKDKLEEIDKELIEEKRKIQRKKVQGEDIDTGAAFAALEKQFSDKKAALSSDLERQRQQVRERLRERRQRRDESEYEAHAAVGMVLLAEQRLKAMESKSKSDASKQRNLMQERLAARRQKRKQEQQQNEKGSEMTSPEARATPEEGSTPSPFAAFKREKTVINVNLSDKERQDILKELDKRTKNYQEKLEKGKEEQQQMIQRRLEAVRKRKERAADEILTNFEREKTIVKERQSRTLERQKTMLVERIEKLKYEKTMTMKDNRTKRVQNFAKIIDDEESSELDKNAKMEKLAEKLQKKLVEEGVADDAQENTLGEDSTNNGGVAESSLPSTSDLPPRPQTASRKLDQEEKGRILKQRMREKKNRKERQSEKEQEDESGN